MGSNHEHEHGQEHEHAHAHRSSESYLAEGDEKLPNRVPRFLCQVPNQKKFVYVSSDSTDEGAEGWNIYLLDAENHSTTKLPVTHGFDDGRGTVVLETPSGNFVSIPASDEPAVSWCDENLTSRDVADFDITEGASGRLVIVGQAAQN